MISIKGIRSFFKNDIFSQAFDTSDTFDTLDTFTL